MLISTKNYKEIFKQEFKGIAEKYNSLLKKNSQEIAEILKTTELDSIMDDVKNSPVELIADIEKELTGFGNDAEAKLDFIENNIFFYKNLVEKIDTLEEHIICLQRDFKFSDEFKNLYKEARTDYIYFLINRDSSSFPIQLMAVDDELTAGDIFKPSFDFSGKEDFYINIFKKMRMEIEKLNSIYA